MLTPFEQYLLQQQLKMQTTVNTSQAPGQSGMTSGAGAPPPTATPVPASGAGGAAGTGGGGIVNTQGGNISQGAVYGGSVTNTASGGTGSLDASGGSNNVYRETTAAPAATPTPSATTPPGAECGMDKPCPQGKFCKMGVCEPIPEGGNPNPDEGDVGDMQGFQQFMSSRAIPSGGGNAYGMPCPSGQYMADDGTCRQLTMTQSVSYPYEAGLQKSYGGVSPCPPGQFYMTDGTCR